jgi:silicon transporter
MNPLVAIKGFVSTCLLIFSIVLIMSLIAKEQTGLSSDANPGAAYALIWIAIMWLTMVEGGQGSLVGLAPVNKELYKDSHPLAYKCTSVTNKGDNLDRYLLGRQLMVVLVVFCVNISGGPVEGAELWGLPQWVIDVFFTVGFAMILFTCMVGQLNSQVNASLCMLDYIDNYFALFTLWVAMAIEFSGLLHASYLIQMFVGWLAGKPIESKEGPRSVPQAIFFWLRCLGSLAVLVLCFVVTLGALFQGKTTMWEGVPAGVSVVVFFILMCVVGMLEGMQIAFFAVAKLTPEERGSSLFAKKTCDLLFKGEGNNLPGFMIGRQLTVVSCMFFVARVTSVSVPEGETLFGVSEGLQELFNTGLLGALALTIVGSIAWQLVASAFPLAFLANPITYYLLRICLFLEATGIASGSWVLAAVHKKIAGFQRDEVYIGTAEERAQKAMEDDDTALNYGTGHIVKLPNFKDHAPKSLQKLLARDPAVAEYINKALDNAEAQKETEIPDIAQTSSNDAEAYCGAFYKK